MTKQGNGSKNAVLYYQIAGTDAMALRVARRRSGRLVLVVRISRQRLAESQLRSHLLVAHARRVGAHRRITQVYEKDVGRFPRRKPARIATKPLGSHPTETGRKP
jgi:hypothetical protein